MEFHNEGRFPEKSSRERALEAELAEEQERYRQLDLDKGLDEWHVAIQEEDKRKRAEEQEEERKKWEKEREEHGIDPLTGATSRPAFEAKLGQAYEAMGRQGEEERRGGKEIREAAVIFVDLDNFKSVNDTIGHAEGDRVLQKAASLLRGALREEDVLGRYGGDEFVVLLLNTAEDDSVVVAEKLRVALDTDPELSKLGITGSIGVCSSSASGAVTPEELVEKADHAMYAAKDGGKNRVVVYGKGEGA